MDILFSHKKLRCRLFLFGFGSFDRRKGTVEHVGRIGRR